MDKMHRKNILLGLFVSLGIVLFIFGIFQIGVKKEMFKKTFLISANFRKNHIKATTAICRTRRRARRTRR